MQAAGLAKLQSDKVRLRAKCQSLLSKAEQIKSTIEWSPVINESSPLQLKPPTSSRPISPQERRILLESSRLNGNLFPPWTSEPDDSVFENSKEVNLHISVFLKNRGVFSVDGRDRLSTKTSVIMTT